MSARRQSGGRPSFVLLLTALDDGINVDRAALRQAGLTRLFSVNSGGRALEIIRGQSGENPEPAVDLIICAGDLNDMSQNAFLRALAALGSPLPVMVISGSEAELARAISHGAAATLRRPYSMNELARAIEGVRARKPTPAAQTQTKTVQPAPPPPAESATAKTPDAPPNKLLWTRTGLRLLGQGDTAQARAFLSGALDYDPLDLEAAMGLSRLGKQEGDMESCHRWLHRAGLICLNTGQSDRAAMIFSRLPEKWQGDHELIEAHELLHEGSYERACEVFVNICASRKEQPLHRLIGRACQFTLAPGETLREVCAALGRIGYESTARSLAARMLSEEDEREPQGGGFLAAFPRLQEVWLVARYTAQALKAS